MIISGTFINHRQQAVSVKFTVLAATGADIVIGNDGGDGRAVWFAADDAVTIESSFNDSMDVLICHSATVRLECQQHIPELFARGFNDVSVKIDCNGINVFTGFVEPNTYSQPYVSAQDTLEVNCIDSLAAMQYCNFRHVGQGIKYSTVYGSAKSETFRDLLLLAVGSVTPQIGMPMIYYDQSRSLVGKDPADVFGQLEASDFHFLGESESDTVSYQDVVADILKYLNLHIVQQGSCFFIFSWEYVRAGVFTYKDILGRGSMAVTWQPETVTMAVTAGDDTQLSQEEAYNRVQLKISPETVDTLVDSPFDSPEPAFPRRQLFMTEYRTGNMEDLKRFIDGDIIQIGGVPYYTGAGSATLGAKTYQAGVPSGKWTSYYIQVMKHTGWTFGVRGTDMLEYKSLNGHNQQEALNALSSVANATNEAQASPASRLYPGYAAVNHAFCPGSLLVDLKKAVVNGGTNDSSIPTSLSGTTQLILAIGGKGADRADLAGYNYKMQDYQPMATYKGKAGAVVSPSDSQTHNYLVIDGKLTLCPSRWSNGGPNAWDHWQMLSQRMPYARLRQAYRNGLTSIGYTQSRDKDAKYIYANWYKAYDCHNEPEQDDDPCSCGSAGSTGFMPFDDDDDTVTDKFKYQYSYPHDGSDKIQFVSVLCCMLVIGDGGGRKCLMSTDQASVFDKLSGTADKAGRYQTCGTFYWQTFKDLDACLASHPTDTEAAYDEYYAQTFAIGIDPKTGDNLLGKEFNFATNFDYRLNIEATQGIAVPLPHDDNLHGTVDFRILGPYEQYMWNHITRRHKTWFRHEKWKADELRLFDYVDYIRITDFSMKLYTDVTKTATTDDEKEDTGEGDIIFLSDTDETFYNKKECEFRLHSAFTTEEYAQLGSKPLIAMSTVTQASDGQGVLRIYDHTTGTADKAEVLYVQAYYNELHRPRATLEHTFYWQPAAMPQTRLWYMPALGQNFYVCAAQVNLSDGTADCTMRQCSMT